MNAAWQLHNIEPQNALNERRLIAAVRFIALAPRQIDVTSELDIKTRGFPSADAAGLAGLATDSDWSQ